MKKLILTLYIGTQFLYTSYCVDYDYIFSDQKSITPQSLNANFDTVRYLLNKANKEIEKAVKDDDYRLRWGQRGAINAENITTQNGYDGSANNLQDVLSNQISKLNSFGTMISTSGLADKWSVYPATTNVNMNGYGLLNVNSITANAYGNTRSSNVYCNNIIGNGFIDISSITLTGNINGNGSMLTSLTTGHLLTSASAQITYTHYLIFADTATKVKNHITNFSNPHQVGLDQAAQVNPTFSTDVSFTQGFILQAGSITAPVGSNGVGFMGNNIHDINTIKFQDGTSFTSTSTMVDNLGNHIATKALNMNSQNITNVQTIYGLGSSMWYRYNQAGNSYINTKYDGSIDFQTTKSTNPFNFINGNVGIDNIAPTAKLDVNGLIVSTGINIMGDCYISGNVGIQTVPDSNFGLKIGNSKGISAQRFYGYSADIWYLNDNTNVVWGAAPNFIKMNYENIQFQTKSSTCPFSFTNGNVGIGFTNPLEKLDVLGNMALTGVFRSSGTAYNNYNYFASSVCIGTGVTQPTGLLHVSTGVGTTSLFVNNTGNVGIGTASPAGKLHVYNGASGITPNANADDLVIENSNNVGLSFLSPSTKASQIFFGDENLAFRGQISYLNSGVTPSSDRDSMIFTINNAERLRITSGGNVGIGTANPGYKLEVSSSGWFGGFVSAESIIDRTPYPETKQIAYDSINSMCKKSTGGVDHEKLNSFVKFEKENKVFNTITKSTDTIIEYSRNLSATVSAQNEVIKDLIKRIEKLEK